MISPNIKAGINQQLLEWYGINQRSYPWRRHRITPYGILITEILLRKTTRNQVIEIFPKFFRRFPTVTILSAATRNEIEKVITPLGMAKLRSKLLKKIALIVIKKHSGKIPLSKSHLLSLPGVGEYIANAVLLMSKKEKVPLVDTNSKRIVERLLVGNSDSRKRVSGHTYALVASLLPQEKYVEFNLALLDLASLICLPRTPRCEVCPLKQFCSYYKTIV